MDEKTHQQPEVSEMEASPNYFRLFQKNRDPDGSETKIHPLLEHYRPVYLAKGGQQVVYTSPDHPNVVIKVSSEPLRRIVEWNQTHDVNLDELSGIVEPFVQAEVSLRKQKQQILKKYFGEGNVLNQKEQLMKIPVTQELSNLVFDEQVDVGEAWTIVTIQTRAKALEDTSRLSLNCGCAEDSRVEPFVGEIVDTSSAEYRQVYKKVSDVLLYGEDSSQSIDKETFLKLHPQLEPILDKADTDFEFRTELADLIQKCVQYSSDTSQILDLIGLDNLVMSKQDGKWKYVHIDSIYPSGNIERYLEAARATVRKIALGKPVELAEKSILKNSINYVRVVNGLSNYLGIGETISLIPEDVLNKPVDFLTELDEQNWQSHSK